MLVATAGVAVFAMAIDLLNWLSRVDCFACVFGGVNKETIDFWGYDLTEVSRGGYCLQPFGYTGLG